MKVIKKHIWIPILLIIVLCGVAFFVLKSGVFEKDELESYDSNTYKEWTFRYVDNSSDKKSDEELEKTDKTLNDIIKEYNEIVFNMDEDTEDFTSKLDDLYVSDDVSGNNKAQNADIYQLLSEENTISSYQDFTELCFTNHYVEKDEYETVTIASFVTTSMKTDNFNNTDFDTIMKYVFNKVDDEWKLYKVYWGKIYLAGTLKAYEKNGLNNTIVYKGDLVGNYTFEHQ